MEDVKKRGHYKRARLINGQSRVDSLQDQVNAALNALPDVQGRFRHVGLDEKSSEFINTYTVTRNLTHGSFCLISPGKLQEILEMDTGGKSFPISSLAASSKPKERKEFLQGILFWAISGNHVVLIQSNVLKAQCFESYVNWLLCEAGLVTPGTREWLLENPLSPSVRKRVNMAKGIKISAPVRVHSILENAPVDGEKTKSKFITSASGKGISIIESLIDGFVLPENVRLDKAVPEDKIHASVYLEWRNKRKSDDTPFLDDIASALRHSDDLEYQIDLFDGVSISDKDFKISTVFNVKRDNGLIIESDLFNKIRTWLYELKSQRRIV